MSLISKNGPEAEQCSCTHAYVCEGCLDEQYDKSNLDICMASPQCEVDDDVSYPTDF